MNVSSSWTRAYKGEKNTYTKKAAISADIDFTYENSTVPKGEQQGYSTKASYCIPLTLFQRSSSYVYINIQVHKDVVESIL